MNKVLIIFRGLNFRVRNDKYNNTHTISALDAIENWKKTIFEDLKKNGIEYEIAFITYESEILEELINVLKPKYLITEGFDNQIENIRVVGDFMNNCVNEYDRFVICRFDYRFRYKITNWPSWNERGILITNPDPAGGLYSDILFVVDSSSATDWTESTKYITGWPHQIGQYLMSKNIPFNLMYQDRYGATEHPLYSYISVEDNPDLDFPKNSPIKY